MKYSSEVSPCRQGHPPQLPIYPGYQVQESRHTPSVLPSSSCSERQTVVPPCQRYSPAINPSYPPHQTPAPELHTHGPAVTHRCRCYSLRADGRVHFGCNSEQISCQADRSIERRPNYHSSAEPWINYFIMITTYSPLLGAHTTAMLSGIMTW